MGPERARVCALTYAVNETVMGGRRNSPHLAQLTLTLVGPPCFSR